MQTRHYFFSGLLTLGLASNCPAQNQNPDTSLGQSMNALLGLQNTLGAIQNLEDERDPKCYATASRLQDFMYGTPLSDPARFKKVELQKNLIRQIWANADRLARAKDSENISASDIAEAAKMVLPFTQRENDDYSVAIPGRLPILIKQTDYRQYSSVAYALRALLGVQQDAMLLSQDRLLTLDAPATEDIKKVIDLASLAALQQADKTARVNDETVLSEQHIVAAWSDLFSLSDASPQPKLASTSASKPATGKPNYEVTRQIIAQKIKSYEAYNNITTPLFLRNIQVYFARHRWPTDAVKSDELKSFFNQAVIFYTTDLVNGAEQVAKQSGHALIRGEDVHTFSQGFVPYRVNEFEDAIFFPRLPREQRVTLEAYDMDAFRDGGLHWRYLEAALDDAGLNTQLEPDPFAAELLAENVAQFGVLVLRLAGDVAKNQNAPHLTTEHIDTGLRDIQQRINAHANAKPEAAADTALVSSDGANTERGDTYFTDVTQQSGIEFEHRIADWLNRLIRSYSVRNRVVAVLAVPPAFGGSGLAAEDFNGDGLPEVLLLSGLGNKLYQNLGQGRFRDITGLAGLNWAREADGLPGETRQPIIADFDNDGDQDILISYVNDAHRLYRNRGDGTFEDVTSIAGLGGEGAVGGPVTAADFDNDGLLDLYVSYFGQYTDGIIPTLARRNDNGLPNQLFKNKGGMRFEDVTQGSGLANTGWTQALSHTDFNRDGWQDIIVGNDFGVNAYYKNNGDNTFENVADDLGAGKPSFTMSIGLGDLNNDLFPDVYISNIVTMDKDQKYVSPSEQTPQKFDAQTLANMRVVEANDLFISQTSKENFRGYELSDSVGRGYSSTGWAWGADFFDFDNDGDNDLYVANGMNDFAVYSTENPYYSDPSGNKRNVFFPDSQRDTNVFFENQGGSLRNVSDKSGANLLGNSRSVAYLDMDNDGDLDMILNNFNTSAVVYRNNSEQFENNWLKIRLAGDPKKGSNRDAIGARIIVSTPDGERMWREVHGSVGYLTMHPKQQHFGLGGAKNVDITIEWPNGELSQFADVSGNKAYRIEQSSEEVTALESSHPTIDVTQLTR